MKTETKSDFTKFAESIKPSKPFITNEMRKEIKMERAMRRYKRWFKLNK